MKNRFITIISSLAAAVLLLSGCQQADGDRDFGYGYVMMPQSQRVEGYYAVPSGGGDYTYNFKVEEGVLKIFLGVLRSGKIADKGFSVGIVNNENEAQRFVNTVESAIIMPAGMFTVPANISVPADSNQATFYMEIAVQDIMKADYDGKKLVACIELSNPTNYTLSHDAFSTIVVMDINAIRKYLD